MRRAISILISFLLISVFAQAQVNHVKRLEFESKDGYGGEIIYPFSNHGFILKSAKDKLIKNKQEWKYDLYNTSLEHQEVVKVLLAKKMYADETFNTETSTHTLYRSRKGDYTIVSLDIESMEVSKVDGKLPRKAWIKEMAIMGNYAIFNASIKRVPFIFAVNLETGAKEFHPIRIKGFSKKKVFIINYQLLEKTSEIFVFAEVALNRKERDIYIIQLNEKGEQTSLYNLSKDIDENIVSISAQEGEDGDYIFSGTYSSKHRGTSEGLFFCKGKEGELDFINFYNFTDLDDFFNYLPKKKQARIKKKKKRKASKGKELKTNYLIADHDVIKLEDGYIFLGEAYYPTYRTETYTTYVNGQTVTHTRQVFDGYRYTHAVIAKFDLEGEMVWDRCFEMYPFYKPYYVKRFISVSEKSEDNLSMVFTSYSRITTKKYDFNGNLLEDRKSDKIETGFKGDKAKRSFTNIDYWYDNYFIAYGNQKIKNKKNKDVKRKRKVFFISKIEY